jgi:lipoprotein signal peptidase
LRSFALWLGKIGDFAVDKDNSKPSVRDSTKRATLCLLVIALVIASDQLTKMWIRTYLEIGESLPLIGRLSLIHISNTGSAFGLLANQTLTASALVLSLTSFTSVCGVIFTGLLSTSLTHL